MLWGNISEVPSSEYFPKYKSLVLWSSRSFCHSTNLQGTQGQDSFSRYVTFSLKACLKASDKGILLELAIAVALQTVSCTPLQFKPKHNRTARIQVLFSLLTNFMVKFTSAVQLENPKLTINAIHLQYFIVISFIRNAISAFFMPMMKNLNALIFAIIWRNLGR